MKNTVTLFSSLFILSLTICTLSSCKKSSGSSYYLRYKVNGTQISDNDGLASLSSPTTLGSFFTLNNPGISIYVHDPAGAIRANVPYTYEPSFNVVYTFGETGLALQSYNGLQYYTFYAKTPGVTIVITRISSNSVQGTFSGVVGSPTAGSSDVNITEGQFNVVR